MVRLGSIAGRQALSDCSDQRKFLDRCGRRGWSSPSFLLVPARFLPERGAMESFHYPGNDLAVSLPAPIGPGGFTLFRCLVFDVPRFLDRKCVVYGNVV